MGNNLELRNDRTIIAQVATYVSEKEWLKFFREKSVGGQWTKGESAMSKVHEKSSTEQSKKSAWTKVVSSVWLRISPILSYGQSTEQSKSGESNPGLDHSLWQTQPWHTHVLEMCAENFLLLPNTSKPLVDRQRNPHQLVVKNSFQLLVWKISGKI